MLKKSAEMKKKIFMSLNKIDDKTGKLNQCNENKKYTNNMTF